MQIQLKHWRHNLKLLLSVELETNTINYDYSIPAKH